MVQVQIYLLLLLLHLNMYLYPLENHPSTPKHSNQTYNTKEIYEFLQGSFRKSTVFDIILAHKLVEYNSPIIFDSQRSMYYSQQSLGSNARLGFVKKVYTVLSAELAFTVFTVWCNYNFKAFARFQERNMWAFWVAFVGTIITLFSLLLGKFTRSFPANFIVLGLFTACESYMVSLICGMYTPASVLLSAVATLSATLGLTYHAMTTSEDYTSFRSAAKGAITSLLWAALAVSLVNLFFVRSSFLSVGVAVLFALVYSVYIIVDTQLILGGKNKELTLDDYVLGSVILYTDIISLFLKLLQILGKKKDE